MTGPAWLNDTLAIVMLVMSAYMAGRLGYAALRGRSGHHDVEAIHLVMGIAMAGMLVTRLQTLPNGVWEAAFALIAVWLAVSIIPALRRDGDRGALGHRAPTLVMCGAMLYSYLAPASGAMAQGMSMGSGASAMALRYPTLGLILVLFLIGYSVLLADRTTLLTAPATVSPAAADGGRARGVVLTAVAPRTLNCCHIAMGVTMAYMIIAML